jgi:hypothetical protein
MNRYTSPKGAPQRLRRSARSDSPLAPSNLCPFTPEALAGDSRKIRGRILGLLIAKLLIADKFLLHSLFFTHYTASSLICTANRESKVDPDFV